MGPPSNGSEASEAEKAAVEDTMKTQMTKAAWMGLAVLAMAVGGASRARADDLVVATVPFAFTVGGSQLPPGTYTVKSLENDPSVLAIESSDGRQNKFLLTLASITVDAPQKDELVFSKHDGKYFLARIVQADGDEYDVMPTFAGPDRDAADGR
jgi:hypothetical protein